MDLDIAEDELFSPAGLGAADVKRAEKGKTPEPRREKKIDIFMDDIAADKAPKTSKPQKKNGQKSTKSAPGGKKTVKKSKKVPAADELFMPFDDGFTPYVKPEIKRSQPKKTKKKAEEVCWWQEKEQ